MSLIHVQHRTQSELSYMSPPPPKIYHLGNPMVYYNTSSMVYLDIGGGNA